MKNHFYKYYAVIGQNGMVIASSWEKALSFHQYIYKPKIHAFETFEEAEDWLFSTFSDWFPRADPPLSMKLNWVHYVRKSDFYY